MGTMRTGSAREFLEHELRLVQHKTKGLSSGNISRPGKRQIYELQQDIIRELIETLGDDFLSNLLRTRLAAIQAHLSAAKEQGEHSNSQYIRSLEEKETLSELIKRWLIWTDWEKNKAGDDLYDDRLIEGVDS
jgi:hypothetical protein